jgi:hypothetical protein
MSKELVIIDHKKYDSLLGRLILDALKEVEDEKETKDV